jgi:hypothetical protein
MPCRRSVWRFISERRNLSMKRASLITLALLALSASTAPGPWIIRFPGQQSSDWPESVLDGTGGDRNLQAIARHFDTAAMLILEANDTIAPVPKPGTQVLIPSQMLLPDVPRRALSSTWRNCGCTTSRRERIRFRSIRWGLASRAGNAGDDHPHRAEDP